MEEGIVWALIILAIVLIVLPFIFQALVQYVIPSLYYLLAVISIWLFFILDEFFSSRLTPQIPWLMWFIWGGVIGAALGFWTVAPRYGLRQQRALIIIAPFALMLLLVCLRFIVRIFS